MTLSKQQIELDKQKWIKWRWIRERDLLELAFRYAPWREKAIELGFKPKRFVLPWPHKDEGRLVKYMEVS